MTALIDLCAKVEARRLNRPSNPVPAGPPAAAPPRALCAHAAKAQSLPARLAESWGVQPQKITFGEMRESGVRRILICCSDYRCSDYVAANADPWPDPYSGG